MEFKKIDSNDVGQAADCISKHFDFANTARADLEDALTRCLYISSGEDDIAYDAIRKGTNTFIEEIAEKNKITHFWMPFFLIEGRIIYFENNQRNHHQLNLFEVDAPFLTVDPVSSNIGISENYNVIMAKHSRAIAFEFADFQNLAMKNERLWHTALDAKMRFVEALSSATRIFLAPTTRMKIAQYLYSYVSRRVERGLPPVVENITQEMLATSFGVSRTTVSEAFMDLKRLGAIEPGYRKFTVNLERCLDAIDEYSRDIQDK